MSVVTYWVKETFTGETTSIWDYATYPWQLALPWQYNPSSATVWTKEF